MPGRYATALFELANDAGEIDRVCDDLETFQAMLDASPDLVRLVRSPLYAAEDQSRAIAAVLDSAGVSGLTANFFQLVIHNRRLFAIRDMAGAFRALLARHRGEVSAEVRSATALSDAQMAALEARLEEVLGQGVQIHTSVDPALLGGLVVKVASRMIDSSIRTKLDNLKVAMKEVG